jgi:hypothetical protein
MDTWRLHKPADPPPPPLKPLTTSGGVWNTTYPKKNRFSQKKLKITHFCLFSMTSSEGDSGKTETYFKKPREVFLHNRMKNKNLSQFFHRCHEKGESKPSLSPIFPVFHFSVTVLILRELFRRAGGEFGETKGGFLSRTCPYTITSFIFFPGVSIKEKQMSEWTPFLQKFGPSFMADSSGFLGICCYFWPRWLNPTS